MKKQIFAIMLVLGISMAVGARDTFCQASQLIKVDVPFSFSANNKVFPAGKYTVSSVSWNRDVWRLQGEHPRSGKFLLAGGLSGTDVAGKVSLTFHIYGARLFLASFRTQSYQVKLPIAKSEKEARQRQAGPRNDDIVMIEGSDGSSHGGSQ